jgi:predicted dinucleotide-utilizing enzyme
MSSRPSTNPRVLRIGIIGCGEVTQVIHIPNLTALSSHFRTAYLCDLSPLALTHCSSKIPGPGPATTHNAAELCASPDVDVVLVASADAFHVPHALLALQHNKYCLLEKPAALCGRDVDVLVAAERASKGKIFVGTMRRYAAVLADAVEEIGGMDQIKYARVRDIIGKNQTFVAQSGMFPKRFTDISDSDAEDLKRREEDMHVQALKEEFGVPVTKASRDMLRLLGGCVAPSFLHYSTITLTKQQPRNP